MEIDLLYLCNYKYIYCWVDKKYCNVSGHLVSILPWFIKCKWPWKLAYWCATFAFYNPRWRHQMDTFSALLIICKGDSPVDTLHKGQCRGALMFSLFCAWTNGWVNNASYLRRHRAHNDVTVMRNINCVSTNRSKQRKLLMYMHSSILCILRDKRLLSYGMAFTGHYSDVIMGAMASRITSLTIVYSNVYSGADQRKHQSSPSLVFCRQFTRDRWIPRTNGQ